ncbi:hypothetical protein SmaMPs15_000058 [Stenotrophomonas maltophilia phage vB_SmaM_Ps15]|uniref:Uncharacterized protein n=1 Tax=Stenotrophomonas maltophilia phage vB_SmaM_Ps15 TaxID=3071007 RepID=A0AAE9JWK4_9CAUD|nr:hypothetical protein PQC01_gp058 [Stenotrophomonas maltophilia phage vB_SmaM_Ps15]UMO77209.1 hypothetical protein SmaMPs15_000058 [Stenotrophomonas maltophilia phage vB_SmaM_Ps15]
MKTIKRFEQGFLIKNVNRRPSVKIGVPGFGTTELESFSLIENVEHASFNEDGSLKRAETASTVYVQEKKPKVTSTHWGDTFWTVNQVD